MHKGLVSFFNLLTMYYVNMNLPSLHCVVGQPKFPLGPIHIQQFEIMDGIAAIMNYTTMLAKCSTRVRVPLIFNGT